MYCFAILLWLVNNDLQIVRISSKSGHFGGVILLFRLRIWLLAFVIKQFMLVSVRCKALKVNACTVVEGRDLQSSNLTVIMLVGVR